jgi:hypothetical protein
LHRHCASDDAPNPAVECIGQVLACPNRHQNVVVGVLDPSPPKFMPPSLGGVPYQSGGLQMLQDPPFGPVKPGKHTHACNSLDPG